MGKNRGLEAFLTPQAYETGSNIPQAESQMELWKLMTDRVWQAIAKQAQEQKQIDAYSTKQNQRNYLPPGFAGG